MACRGRRREPRLRRLAGSASAQMAPARMAEHGDKRARVAGHSFTSIGCGGTAKTDPGTAKGTYIVVVTGTAGSGSSQSQASVNVPITIQ